MVKNFNLKSGNLTRIMQLVSKHKKCTHRVDDFPRFYIYDGKFKKANIVKKILIASYIRRALNNKSEEISAETAPIVFGFLS